MCLWWGLSGKRGGHAGPPLRSRSYESTCRCRVRPEPNSFRCSRFSSACSSEEGAPIEPSDQELDLPRNS